jgi:uncharacterized protein (DUF2141 family)
MRTQLKITEFIALGFVAVAPLARAGELTVTVSDIRNANGTLSVAVVNTEAAWDSKEAPVAAQRLNPTAPETVLHFNLPAGTYAVQVMHDENGNGKLDTNFMGVPTEGYGFSNNPQALRKAYFSEARFEVTDAPAAIVVRLR